MDFKDYYKTLGVEKDASQDDIKRAYRKLARKYHPDINKEEGAEGKFKELSEANEVIGDAEKRAAYDDLGKDYRPGEEFRPNPDWDAGYEFSGGPGQEETFSDFFESLFGQRQRQAHGRSQQFQARGQDHHAKISIDLEDTFSGAQRAIQLKTPRLTDDGHVITETRTVNVTIPKGVRAGQNIRLKGQGSPGLGDGKAGDLYLEIKFNPHSIYRADGRDIYLGLPVAPWEAALGGKVKAPTPAGTIDVTIPANSTQGRKLRIKGKGIPGKQVGDLYFELQISLPPADSEHAKEFYKKMQEELSFNPRAKFTLES
jgi:curved DNA-binding protein